MRDVERPQPHREGTGKKSLTGEEEVWYLVAERLGMSVDEAKSKIGPTEFYRWQERMDREPNEFHWLKWSLAAIRFEISELPYILFGGKGTGRTIKDMLLTFEKDKPKKKATPAEKQKIMMEKIEKSKGFFGLLKSMSEDMKNGKGGRRTPVKKKKPEPKPEPVSPPPKSEPHVPEGYEILKPRRRPRRAKE